MVPPKDETQTMISKNNLPANIQVSNSIYDADQSINEEIDLAEQQVRVSLERRRLQKRESYFTVNETNTKIRDQFNQDFDTNFGETKKKKSGGSQWKNQVVIFPKYKHSMKWVWDLLQF